MKNYRQRSCLNPGIREVQSAPDHNAGNPSYNPCGDDGAHPITIATSPRQILLGDIADTMDLPPTDAYLLPGYNMLTALSLAVGFESNSTNRSASF